MRYNRLNTSFSSRFTRLWRGFSQTINILFGSDKYSSSEVEKNIARLGFSLIELLVVISLIGILLAISTSAYSQSKKSARDAKRKADMEQIRSALEIYRNDCKEYPKSDEPVELIFGETLTGGTASCLSNVYMTEVPNDPLSPTQTYWYYRAADMKNEYTLCAALEVGGDDDLTGCGTCGAEELPCNYKVKNP